jgi:hypothetical protein
VRTRCVAGASAVGNPERGHPKSVRCRAAGRLLGRQPGSRVGIGPSDAVERTLARAAIFRTWGRRPS